MAGLYIFRLAAINLSPESFGVYALARRVISLSIPFLMLGLGVALPRFVALKRDDEECEALAFLATGLTIVIVVLGLCVAVLITFPSAMSRLAFGSETYTDLLPPIALWTAALCMQSLCYGYWRGRLAIQSANVLQVLVIGGCPIFAFILGGSELGAVLWVSAGLSLTFSVAALAFAWGRKALNRDAWGFKPKELLGFGLARVPGDIALALLIALPSLVAAQTVGVLEAGAVAFGTTLVIAAGTAVSPLSTLMLPVAVRLLKGGGHSLLRSQIDRFLLLIVPIYLAGIVGFYSLADFVIPAYLGLEYSSVVPEVRTVFLSALPYAVFVALRSICDAAFITPINSYNCFYALLVYATITPAFWFYVGVGPASLVGFVVAMGVLAGLTVNKAYAATRMVG